MYGMLLIGINALKKRRFSFSGLRRGWQVSLP